VHVSAGGARARPARRRGGRRAPPLQRARRELAGRARSSSVEG
jgi:hypothetical protein